MKTKLIPISLFLVEVLLLVIGNDAGTPLPMLLTEVLLQVVWSGEVEGILLPLVVEWSEEEEGS